MNSFFKLVISVVACLAVGGISGYFTAGEINTWYATLHKPSFNPPDWLFAPAWTTLYIMMGIAFWIIWKNDAAKNLKNKAVFFFNIQLALNFCWSVIFFHFHQPALAFADIILLWIFILLSIISFKTISDIAAGLLIPYILWVSFAAALNFSIWKLN